MKKPFFALLFLISTVIGTSAFIIKSSTGLAGYAGSPGELTCSGGGSCHGGGSSAAAGVTISATPSFTSDQYMADSTYQINIQVAALGFNRYGFGCEILDSLFANTGTIQAPGAGVKLLNSVNGRRNAVHTSPKLGSGGTTFSFKWVAPSEGRVNIYAVCNAVNFNGSTSGDLPIPAYAALYPAPLPPVDTTSNQVGLSKKPQTVLSEFKIYPNPVRDYANVSYILRSSMNLSIELISIEGVKLKEIFSAKQNPGRYDQFIKVPELPAGAYFIRISGDGEKISQKLVTIF